jgi:hypothetical protein
MGAYNKLPGQERQMRGAFSVQCPECGAPPGFACRKPKGRSPYDSHKEPAESVPTRKPWPKPWVPHTDQNSPVHAHKPRTVFISLQINE